MKKHRSELVPVSNYSAAITRAVEWLGDRYLLAKPIKPAPGRVASGATPADSGRACHDTKGSWVERP
jgi:hypothetical protein